MWHHSLQEAAVIPIQLLVLDFNQDFLFLFFFFLLLYGSVLLYLYTVWGRVTPLDQVVFVLRNIDQTVGTKQCGLNRVPQDGRIQDVTINH